MLPFINQHLSEQKCYIVTLINIVLIVINFKKMFNLALIFSYYYWKYRLHK